MKHDRAQMQQANTPPPPPPPPAPTLRLRKLIQAWWSPGKMLLVQKSVGEEI